MYDIEHIPLFDRAKMGLRMESTILPAQLSAFGRVMLEQSMCLAGATITLFSPQAGPLIDAMLMHEDSPQEEL